VTTGGAGLAVLVLLLVVQLLAIVVTVRGKILPQSVGFRICFNYPFKDCSIISFQTTQLFSKIVTIEDRMYCSVFKQTVVQQFIIKNPASVTIEDRIYCVLCLNRQLFDNLISTTLLPF
jgi:hypothetical protein